MTAEVITRTAVAANQLVIDNSDGSIPSVLWTASNDIPLLGEMNWLPDGSGVIFDDGYKNNRQLYTFQPLVTDTVPYAIPGQPAGDNIQPACSPNGTWVAFISTVEGHRKLFVMNEDGSMNAGGAKIYQMTDGSTFESYPSWHPDGQKIVFVSEGTLPADLFSLNVGNWLGGALPTPLPAWSQLPNQDGITKEASPHYSPDKRWIVYSALVYSEIDAKNHRRIFVMSTDTINPTMLQLGGEANSNESDPSWSLDSKTLIFISDRAGNPDIYTMDMSFLYNPDPQHHVPPPYSLYGATAAFESSPVFSPIDQRIVFIRRIGRYLP